MQGAVRTLAAMTEQTPPAPGYWFRAKRYGWGWGLPTAWQGWVVFGAYFVLVIGGAIAFPQASMALFIAYEFILTCLLFVICWIKGEPPRWRWG